MSADVMYKVRTVYETQTAGSSAGIARMSGVLGGLGSMLGAVKSGLGTLFTAGAAAGAVGLAAGVALLSHGITTLNADVESTSMGIAGMVNAAQVANASGGIASWGESLDFAEATMTQIRRDAAALPGEAGDFIEVFRGGLAASLDAGMAASDVAGFTNRFAAVGISFRVDAPQIGRDLNLMLQGRAGAHVNMWNRLKSTIGKTAEEFNRLTAAQRQAAISTAIGRYQNMIDAYGSTWEAVSSTTRSYFSELVRYGSRPLFTAMKGQLSGLNVWWAAHERVINEVANGVGGRLAAAYTRAGAAARSAGEAVNSWSRTPAGQALMNAPSAVMGGVRSLAGQALGYARANPGRVASGAGVAAGIGMGIPGLGLVAGGLFEFSRHTTAVNAVLGSLSEGGQRLYSMLGVVWGLFAHGEVLLGQLFAATLPGVTAGLSLLLTGLDGAFQFLGPAVHNLVTALSPVVLGVGSVLGGIAELAGGLLGPLIRDVGHFISDLLNGLARLTTGIVSSARTIWSWLRDRGIVPPEARRMTSAEQADLRARAESERRVTADLFGLGGGQGASTTGLAATVSTGLSNMVNRNDSQMDAVLAGIRANNTPVVAPAPVRAAPAESAMDRLRSAMEHLRAPLEERGGGALGRSAAGARAVQRPGHTAVNVHIHQTVTSNEDPDRLLLLTRRAVVQGIHAAIESPNARVAR